MATPILKVMTDYCAVLVDDIRLTELANENPPLYARKMWGYFQVAITYFTIPRNMPLYLLGTPTNPKLTEPKFDDYQYVCEDGAAENVVIELGEEYIGYELFCCRLITYDDFGNIVYLPVNNAVYDADAGTVTLTASEENPIEDGAVFDMDFYKDGEFVNTLTPEMMRILGLCFEVVWWQRFNNNFLSTVPKVEGKSFSIQNTANKDRANNETLQAAEERLASAMRAYDTALAYRKTFPNSGI